MVAGCSHARQAARASKQAEDNGVKFDVLAQASSEWLAFSLTCLLPHNAHQITCCVGHVQEQWPTDVVLASMQISADIG